MSDLDIDHLELDLDDLTIGEMEDIEDIIDAPIDSLTDPTAKKAKTLRALAFIAARRTHPDIKLGDLDNVKLSVLGGGEEPDPS